MGVAAFFLIAVVVSIVSTTVAAAAAAYDIVVPRSAIPGETLTISAIVSGSKEDASPVFIDVALANETKTLATTTTRNADTQTRHRLIQIKVPHGVEVEGVLRVRVTARDERRIVQLTDQPVTIRSPTKAVIVQTDKPIYKPGDTVLGRVIVLRRDMTAARGNVTVNFRLKNQNVNIASFKNLLLDSGVANFSLPLSPEPVLGDYVICADYGEKSPVKEQECFSFKVDEYVLPKFSCTVTPSDDTLACAKKQKDGSYKWSICFNVNASYTYGQKVKGTLTYSASVPSARYGECPIRKKTIEKIHGSVSACVDACVQYKRCDDDIDLSVHVVDDLTGHRVKCTGKTQVKARKYHYKIDIENDDNTFYPCKQSIFKVRLSTITGRPVSSTGVRLNCSARVRNENGTCTSDVPIKLHKKTKRVDVNGQAQFSLCAPCNALQIKCEAQGAARRIRKRTQKSEIITRNLVHTPDYMSLSATPNIVSAGEFATVEASTTSPASVTFYIVAKGSLIGVQGCDPMQPAKLQKDRCAKLGKTNSYACRIRVPVKNVMIPSFTVLAEQKGLSVAKLTLNAQPNPSDQIKVKFVENEVRPADVVTLNITAPPTSYVGIVAVDQSVYVQQSKNQITTEKLNEKLGLFDEKMRLSTVRFRCGGRWTWNCACKRYGCMKKNGKLTIWNCRPDKCFNKTCEQSQFEPVFCEFATTSAYFEASGLHPIQNSTTNSRPANCDIPPRPAEPESKEKCCWPIFSFMRSRSRLMARTSLVPALMTASQRQTIGPLLPPQKIDQLQDVSQTRTYFPETWIWTSLRLGNVSSVGHQFRVPHTITSWVVDAFALSRQTPMTVAVGDTVNVFQPFFCSLYLPYSVVRGETVKIKATVHNYLSSNLNVYVRLVVNAKEISVIKSKRESSEGEGKEINVRAGEGKTIEFSLLPLKIGSLPIQCVAQSTQASDSIIKNLLVEAEGVEEEYSLPLLICLGKAINTSQPVCKRETFDVTLPNNFVKDSERAIMSFTADYMGPSIKGLEKLLKLPTGCGEQNMLKFAPAVYVTRYLTTTNRIDEETRAKAMRFMLTGYQRELTFQRDDGSYSAFGQRDPCGSMWLTSFVVRTFGQAHGLLSIDNSVQRNAIQWIKRKQSGSGAFPPVCRVLNKEMQGCASGECSLTAYTLLALLDAGATRNDESVRSGLKYLLKKCISSTCDSTYNLALIAYALRKAGHSDANRALSRLRKCATLTTNEHVSWSFSKEQCHSSPWRRNHCIARSCDVETTAYALLAFVVARDAETSAKIARWLTEQRNANGGFKSTQDTVVALHALFEYAELNSEASSPAVQVDIKTARGFAHSLRVDEENAHVMQDVAISNIPAKVHVKVCGIGCILAQAGVTYNVPKPDNALKAFQVESVAVKESGTTCRYKIEICNRWRLSDPISSNMAVCDVALFSGFAAIHSDLKTVEKGSICDVKRVETEGRRLRFYLDEVTDEKCCFSFAIKREVIVEDLKGVPVITYNYYNPDQTGGTMMHPPGGCKDE